MPLFNQFELRALEFKEDAIYRTRIIRTEWFEFNDEPQAYIIHADNTAWYPTGESRIAAVKPE